MKTSTLLKRFVPYYRNYVGIMIMDLFCAALTTVCELVLPLILRYITNLGMNDLSALTVQTIVTIGALYFVLRIIDGMASFYMAYTGHVMGASIETDMREDAFAHLQKLSDNYFNNTKVGQIMSRITSDLFDVTEFAHHCPEEFFIAFVKTVVSFVILARINVLLTVIIFVLIPVMAVSCSYFNLQVRKAFKRQRNHIGELNARIEDSLLGNKVVRAFANEAVEIGKFNRDNQEFLKIKRQTYKYMAAFQNTIRMFDGLMYVVVIVAGGIFMIKGLIMPADLVAYTLYVTTLLSTIRRIIEFAEQFQRGMTGIERFTELMDANIDIFDEEGAVPLRDVEGEITFKHVSFEYPDDHTPVLSDINLTIKPGEKVALVGPSGGGKTTLCNLIPRFYDPTEGEILLDGQNIRNVTLESLRSNVGVVQQDVYLFSGSVYENIAYGKPGATREEVVRAAKMAGAHEFIEGLKDGYDTYVGERGVKLSGGQKQRISIARVMLRAPKLVVLDEATAALDNESEHLVAESLDKLAAGRTTLTIAHRLTTIQGADRILVLSGSRIVEEGNHETLMKQRGIYYQLYTSANMADQEAAEETGS
ncbi:MULTISPECIES: ABC transporter ATP-binding protein [Enterocloster]|uniref:ATP-binding cassette, subfamily B n=2 Tax=Enterocloster lavalensis TaxID=460384 RepID=A0A1I0E5Q2_9FIRM|nr:MULTISPECIES: ABC transporter ATP-binding protein [Enterocloster]MDR3757425.1 ABC transporter ATP-binding protein [Enterocloster sp.]PST34667.1 ABC transporter ATP-binding protein [Enterocloster lavalensis]SET39574.1 ATP-binding cassette, subfamily B [Enterocloster lavalensis]